MSQAVRQLTARFTTGSGSSVTSAALGSSTLSGSQLVLTAAVWGGTSGATMTGSDSKTNTGWSTDVSQANGGSAVGVAGIMSALNIANVGTSHTGTVTSSHAGSAIEGNFMEVTGTATSAALDKTAVNSLSTGNSSITATTAATTQADELVVACAVINGGLSNEGIANPATSGYTSIGVNQDSNSTIGYQASYKIVAATGAQSATWGFTDTAATSGAVVATYKAAGGGGSTFNPGWANATKIIGGIHA